MSYYMTAFLSRKERNPRLKTVKIEGEFSGFLVNHLVALLSHNFQGFIN